MVRDAHSLISSEIWFYPVLYLRTQQKMLEGETTMTISGFWLTFIVGCFGGIAGESLNWYLRRESPRIAQYYKGTRYWITTAVMIIVGGVLVTLYGVEEKSALLVANIGLSAPLILKSLAQVPSQGTTKALDQESPSILDFIAGR